MKLKYQNQTVDIVLGMAFGDEGKGKVVDCFAENYDYVVRFNGGNNAGHSLKVGNRAVSVHALPSGVLRPQVFNVIGNGCVVNPIQLAEEIQKIGIEHLRGRVFVSHAAHIITPEAIEEDCKGGSKERIGTTGRGIGPTYAAKMNRTGLRMEDLAEGDGEKLFSKEVLDVVLPLITNTTALLKKACDSSARILLEGAQGCGLDIDHGTYPYVTSSSCSVAGALAGTGLSHKNIRKVIGVTKAYSTRVGEGPFLSEVFGRKAEILRAAGNEYGTTTGRPRRVGWLDAKQLREACEMNGVDQLVITKLDVLSGLSNLEICHGGASEANARSITSKMENPKYPSWDSIPQTITKYSDLPQKARDFVDSIESVASVPVTHVSIAPDRAGTLPRP